MGSIGPLYWWSLDNQEYWRSLAMRFSLRTLLLAISLFGIGLGLGAGQPLLVGFLFVMIAPLAICYWRYCDKQARLMACTIALCAFVVAGWGASYVCPLEIKLRIQQQSYRLAFCQGRIVSVCSGPSNWFRFDPFPALDVSGWITVDDMSPMQSEAAGFEWFRGGLMQNGWVYGWTIYPPVDAAFASIFFGFRFTHVFLFYLTALFARCAVMLAWRSERRSVHGHRRLVAASRAGASWSV